MADMYFVKQPYDEENGRMEVSFFGIHGAVPLGRRLILYQGDDKKRAQAVVQNLRRGVLCTYLLDPDRDRVSIHHDVYRDGRCGGSSGRVLPTEKPMQKLLETTLNFPRRSETLAEVFGEFTAEEVDYLNSLEMQEKVA